MKEKDFTLIEEKAMSKELGVWIIYLTRMTSLKLNLILTLLILFKIISVFYLLGR